MIKKRQNDSIFFFRCIDWLLAKSASKAHHANSHLPTHFQHLFAKKTITLPTTHTMLYTMDIQDSHCLRRLRLITFLLSFALSATTLLAKPDKIPTAPADVTEPGKSKLPKPIDIAVIKVIDGLTDPINIASAEDGTNRLFIIERRGVVKVLQDGELLKQPFLDISDLVLSDFIEQGLLDIAFHPKFKSNGKFYVHYSEKGSQGSTIIAEYKASNTNKNKAMPKQRKIMQVKQPFVNHNGGELAFGPNGYLYISLGDGGGAGDPVKAGQDLNTLLGKILRIDVDNTSAQKAYSIPRDNPFANQKKTSQSRPEIWAYGLRNPWKIHFDRKTGDLYIADVGQNHWEEINYQPSHSKGGVNYGWVAMEGAQHYPKDLPQKAPISTLPIAQYSHHQNGISVTGLGIYRGSAYPSLNGTYFAADWASGKIWGIQHISKSQWAMQELLDTTLKITGSGEATDGSIYLTTSTINYGQQSKEATGAVWKIVAADKVPQGAVTIPTE